MAGKMNISSNGGDIICRNNSRAIVLDTYYYSNWNAGVPAEAIRTDSYDAANGKLCYQLNAGRKGDRQAWFQTLAEDHFPVPDNRHLPVWYYAGSYINEDPDGLETIQNPKSKIQNDEAVYDLSGRRILTKPSRGVYIQHNRKYVK